MTASTIDHFKLLIVRSFLIQLDSLSGETLLSRRPCPVNINYKIEILNKCKNNDMIKVFFDGKCGLCNKEINYYRSIARAGDFLWEDVANDPSPLLNLRVTQADALRRLHAQDSDGRLYIGVAAFVLIWQKLPYFKWAVLAWFIKLPLIYQFSAFLYGRFADYRFAKLPHCKI